MKTYLRPFLAGLGLAGLALASSPVSAQLIRLPVGGIINPTHTLYKDQGGVVTCYGKATNCKVTLPPKVIPVFGPWGSPIGF